MMEAFLIHISPTLTDCDIHMIHSTDGFTASSPTNSRARASAVGYSHHETQTWSSRETAVAGMSPIFNGGGGTTHRHP